LRALVQEDAHWRGGISDGEFQFLIQAAGLFGARHSAEELRQFLDLLTHAPETGAPWHLALAAGLAEGLARSDTPLRDWLQQPRDALPNSMALRWAIVGAGKLAASPENRKAHRVAAIRLLARADGKYARPLLDLLQSGEEPEIISAAASAAGEVRDHEFAQSLYDKWEALSPATRRQVIAASVRSPVAADALSSALEEGQVAITELDASARQALLKKLRETNLRPAAQQVLTQLMASERGQVLESFQPALKLGGDRARGAGVFAKQCALCHAVQGAGQRIGPDLSGLSSRSKATLLVDILDPSRQVAPDFVSYTVITTEGDTLTGLIASEDANGIRLRRAVLPDESLPRAKITEIRADAKSLMPDGLEQGLSHQDMADLLQFLVRPEAQLLPKAQ
jgi:putative heme-binding domain-containing protein